MNLQDRISAEQRIANDGSIKHLTFVQADGAQTYQMKASEKTVIITSGHSANTMTITLPPVQECAGQFYYIGAVAGATATTTLVDDGDDAGFANKTLDADDDHILLYSTGHRWLIVTNGIA